MRTPSKDLFLLIKSLSKGEKRNFKLQAGIMTGDKKYIQLFDSLDRQEDYDEQKLSRDYVGGQFSVAKNYLYKLIMRSLSHYHKGKRIDLASKIQQVNILAEKELYEQADKLLDRCIEEARKTENLEILVNLLNQKGEILYFRYDDEVPKSEIDSRNSMMDWCVRCLGQIKDLEVCREELKRKAAQLKPRISPGNRKELLELFTSPLLEGQTLMLTKRGSVLRLGILFMLHFYCKDFDACLKTGKEISDEIVENLHFLQENEVLASKILRNLGVIALRQNELSLASESLERLASLRPRSKRSTKAWFYRYYSLKLLCGIYSYSLWDCHDAIESYFREKKKLKVNPSPFQENWLFYLFSYQHFLEGRFTEALQWMNRLLNNVVKGQEPVLLCYARLLNLLIHFELGNSDYLASEISNTQRYLNRKNELNPTVNCFLLNLRKVVNAGGIVSMEKNLLRKFRESYAETHARDQDQLLDRPILDVLSWIESRISGQSMREIRIQTKNKLLLA